jgi:AcrR family transcriptional regulator
MTARARRHEATRREILDAAWAQAEEKGVAGISLRELASAVGMRAPSLYTYFDGKDAIYDAMFAQGYEALLRFSSGVMEEATGLDRIQALAAVVERFVGFCQESPARYQLMFTRAVPGWEPSSAAYAVSVASTEAMAQALAGLGIADQDTLDLYVALSAGLAAQQMANEPQGGRWRKLARPAMEMLIAHHDRNQKGRA